MKRYQILMLALPVALGMGCKSEDVLGTCDADISAKVETFSTAAATLGTVSASITVDVFDACNNIAEAMGETAIVPATAGKPTDEEVKMACNLVKAGLKAELMAGATVNVIYEPAVCTVNAEASIDCSANCDVSGECTPPMVTEIECTGGELSFACDGTCEGTLSCEVSASAQCGATCEGSCSGSCTGSCEGTAMCTGTCDGECSVALDQQGNCMGECKGTCSASASCEGKCDATCMGSCEGKCVVEAAADCSGEVRCEGSCTGTATAPSCSGGSVTPPMCDVDVDCQAGCDTQASLEATCTEPSVTVTVDAAASANVDAVIAALEENLPLLLSITAKGELLGEAASNTADAFGNLVESAGTIPACVAEFGADVAASAQASVEASVSVSVSIQASASVSGCASGGSANGCNDQN